MLKKELLDVLACPKCKGDLQHKKTHLVCRKCKLRYKILEGGVPDMLIDHAEKI